MPHATLAQQRYTRKEQMACRYARRFLSGSRHEENVLQLASRLFRITAAAGAHKLSTKHRRILRLAALLHDVGRCMGDRNHPSDGARMILRNADLPLSSRMRRCIAYLTRYHRGAVPEIGYDEILRRGDGRKSMRQLLGLLRAADSLDSRQFHSGAKVKLSMRGKRLAITCLTDETPRSFGRRKKFRLMEETMGVRVDVSVRA